MIAQNTTNIQEVVRTDPSLDKSITLKVGPLPYEGLRQSFVYSSIGTELLLTLGFIFFHRSRLVQGFLLVFIASIELIVSEYKFASTFLYMGFELCPVAYLGLKMAHRNILLIYVLFALVDHVLWM